jgi:hypothetical protein
MLWGNRRAAEPTDIFGLVRVNDRVQLDIKGRLYASRVEDIQPGEVHVAVPYEQDRMVTVTPH